MAAATRSCIKRVKLFVPMFCPGFMRRNLCIAAAEVEKNVENSEQRRKKKEKDPAKVLEYEQYHENVQNTLSTFRVEYERKQAKEKQRINELNEGRFSPIEQQKITAEKIRKYNETKENIRKGRQKENVEKMKTIFEKQKLENDSKQLAKNREIVLKMIEESKSFITMENLEDKIKGVLESETNYNFALTANRRRIMSTEPPGNMGYDRPGPAAYQAAGFRFRKKSTEPAIKLEIQQTDDMDNEMVFSESSDSNSDSSDSDSSDSESEVSDSNDR